MKLIPGIFVLAALGVIIINASAELNDTEDITNNHTDSTVNSSEERRWMPVFPKNIQKLVITIKPARVINNVTTVRPKNPVFKIIPKAVKMKSKNYWKTATTRQPLMKYTKFTVNPLTTFKIITNSIRGNKKESENKYDAKLFRKIMDANKEESSEQETETTTVIRQNENITNSKTRNSQFRKVRSEIIKEKYADNIAKFKDIFNDKTKTKSEFSSEEEDREEFIFVTPTAMKEHTIIIEDSEESMETATATEKDINIKQKRSVNVIEEENLATTVSGFKFTGKVASLSSDIIFRNINT